MIYKCDKCKKEIKLLKTTICIINNKVETKEALCDCGLYMKQVYTKEHEGMPGIIRTEPSLNKK